MSETDSNKRLIRRYFEEVFNESKLEVLDEIAAHDYIEHMPFPGHSQGIEGVRQRVTMIKDAFDPRFTLEQIVAEGDKVVVMWSNRGTHQGEFFGVPPTHKTVVTRGIDIYVIRDGRMAEHWDVVDLLGTLMQIGAIPAPAPA